MSDFDSGNSVNCILLDVNLYENKEGKIICPLYLKVAAKDTNDISNTFRYGLGDKAQFLRNLRCMQIFVIWAQAFSQLII